MFSKKLMKATYFVAVIALALMVAFVFVACDKGNNNTNNDNPVTYAITGIHGLQNVTIDPQNNTITATVDANTFDLSRIQLADSRLVLTAYKDAAKTQALADAVVLDQGNNTFYVTLSAEGESVSYTITLIYVNNDQQGNTEDDTGEQGQGEGEQGQGEQGQGQGEQGQGQGEQGQGQGSEGQGQGNQGEQGQGEQGQGQGEQGQGSEGQGQGEQGQGSEGQGEQGQGEGNQGEQGQGEGNQGEQGQGEQGQGQGQGEQGQGQGEQGQGSEGQGEGNQGEQGQGEQGQGEQGQGEGNQGEQGQGEGNQGEQGQGEQGQGQGNQGEQGQVTATDLEINVDEDSVFTANNIDAIDEALTVSVVMSDKTRTESVQFEVKSTTVSQDGTYADVVVEAYGIEKTIRVSLYTAPEEEEPLIREDLLPLYELLTAEGDKGIKLSVMAGSYVVDSDSEDNSYSISAIFNILEQEGYQFALYSEDEQQTNVYACYDNGEIALGKAFDVSRLVQLVMSFLANEEPDEEYVADFEVEDEADYVDDVDYEEMDSLTYAFVNASNVLDLIDSVAKMPLTAIYPGLKIVHVDAANTYIVSIDCNTLIDLLQTYVFDDEDKVEEQEEDSFDFARIVSTLDEYLDGAITNGKIKVQAVLSIGDDGVVASVRVKNEDTGLSAFLDAIIKVSDEAYALPEQGVEAKDLEITIPVVLPQQEIEINLDAVVHISDIFAAEGKDILTACVYSNDETLVRFNLNDYYAYLDVTGLLGCFSDEEVPYTAYYYAPIDENEEPISVFDDILDRITRRLSGDYDYEGECGDKEDDPGYIDDDYDNEDDEGPSYFAYYVDYQFVAFEIGATEDDLRAVIFAGYYDDELNEEVEAEYTVVGFDSSASFFGNVIIDFGNGIEEELQVIVYNPDTREVTSLEVDSFKVALGTAIGDADYYGIITCSDGEIEWEEPAESATIIKLNDDDVGAEAVFGQVGENNVIVACEGLETEVAVYVYDPENLKIVGIASMTAIGFDKDEEISEEVLRNVLGDVTVIFDNGEEDYTSDYTIEGFELGVDSFTVEYKGFTAVVNVVYGGFEPDDPGDEDDEEYGFSILELLPYLRFVEFGEEDDMIDTILNSIANFKAIIESEANKALFADVFQIETDENGYSVRVFINNEDDADLLAIINLFVGIPTQDGFVDINAGTLFDYIGSMEDWSDTIYSTFNKIVGVELEDVVSDLAIEIACGKEDGLYCMVRLTDTEGETVYFETGVNVRMIPQASQFELTDTEVKGAKSFDLLKYDFLPIVLQLMSVQEQGELVEQNVE